MFVQQLYTNCLAEAAYYIESNGEVAIVDPIREIEPYIALAESRGSKIKYVFETHFHADFVSGHIDLAKRTGATIVFGPLADTAYDVLHAKDGEEFQVGHLTLRALHTPGHTPESTCYLLLDNNYQEYCVFTGDTLFVGDVGRPDLLDGKMTSEELASMLYDSLNTKIKNLPDEVIVYPAHGPGSSCGKSIGKETWSTIGHQKKSNYALREMSRTDFVREVTQGLLKPPAYFFEDARINKQGYDNINDVIRRNNKSLTPDAFQTAIKNGAVVLDTRASEIFKNGYIKDSINIGLNGMFAIWVGTIIKVGSTIAVICEVGKEEETVLRLARVGYEKIAGVLQGGIDTWKNAGLPVETVASIELDDFVKKVNEGATVLDVRKLSEVENGYIKNATTIPLADLDKNTGVMKKDEAIYIHCAGGYRSMIAASLMKSKGYKNVVYVHSPWSRIKECNVPIVKGVPDNVVTG